MEFMLDIPEDEASMSKVANVAKEMKKFFLAQKIKVQDVLVRNRPRVDILQIAGTK